MPSRVSFFNPVVYRKNLTRFAPLWLAYLAFWMVVMPFSILSRRGDRWFTVWDLQRMALGMVEFTAIVCLAYAILIAMALHGWYYRSASVNALGALPIRRETWFCTNLLTALTMGLIPNLIVALSIWAAAASIGLAGGVAAMSWLAINSLVFLFDYALAALCAAVVGQILALPALYILVNFAAIVLNYVTVTILSTFVYGLNANNITALAPLSPAFYLCTRSSVFTEYKDEFSREISRIEFPHWGYLLGLTVVALVLLAAAFLLFRRRRMEAAGDMIAVRPLRPVFKYCFAAGCALVLGTIAAFVFFSNSEGPNLPVMLICLLIGGAVGYFTAEILLKKTFRVFGREWIGCGVFSLCLVAAVLMMEFDATGYERRVPNSEDVESVSVDALSYGHRSFQTDDPALIADITTLHRSIVQDKSNQEALSSDRWRDGGMDSVQFRLQYYLRDGSVMERRYNIHCTPEQWRDTNSPGRLMSDLLSRPAVVMLSVLPNFPIQGPENILYAELHNHGVEALLTFEEKNGDAAVSYEDTVLSLSQEESWELFNSCVLPDLREGKIGKPTCYSFQNEPEYSAEIRFRFFSDPNFYNPNSLTLTPGSRTARYFLDRGCILMTTEETDALWEAAQ